APIAAGAVSGKASPAVDDHNIILVVVGDALGRDVEVGSERRNGRAEEDHSRRDDGRGQVHLAVNDGEDSGSRQAGAEGTGVALVKRANEPTLSGQLNVSG